MAISANPLDRPAPTLGAQGVSAASWLQAEWVARRRIAWHRRAGWLGAAIALGAAGSGFGQSAPRWFA